MEGEVTGDGPAIALTLATSSILRLAAIGEKAVETGQRREWPVNSAYL